MTPKEKAEELFSKYYSYLKANLMYDEEAKEDAKVCTLIAVDQLLNEKWNHNIKRKMYWREVKEEIKKI